LARRLFSEVQPHLAAKGLKVTTGTIVDATIIIAPSSTKNADKARDPEMHQTKKGKQGYFARKRTSAPRRPKVILVRCCCRLGGERVQMSGLGTFRPSRSEPWKHS
jgi:hypothetical protein